MPSWKFSVGSPSLLMPMLPVATPLTEPSRCTGLRRPEAREDLHAQRLGLLAIQRTKFDRLTM
jgi:hypothetical protein